MAFMGVHIAFGVLDSANTIGDYSLFTGLAGQLWISISMFSSSILQIYDNKLKIENIKKLDFFKHRVADNGTTDLLEIKRISFENVSFTYPGTTVPALSNINLSLYKNEKVVLVGLNGSGKSTLIKLLLRMYDPDTGVIRINNLDIKEYKLHELRANFSVYFQEMHNYNFTLRENFTLADDGQDEAMLEPALIAASGSDILKKATKGMATSLSRLYDQEGLELSRGQHQKLALARVLYRRHTALILDEPSSNLDPKAEHEIFNTLTELSKDKMTIFTSHRLSNVSLADRILVLEKGQVVEDGTQEELLKSETRYAKLFRYQKEKYVNA